MALTPDDLKAIGDLLEPINRKLDNVATKQDVKAIVATNNSIFGTLFKTDLATTAQQIIKAVKAGFQDVVTHIKPMDEKIEDHEERIERIEGHTGLAHKN